MAKRRQSSGAFFRRLEEKSELKPVSLIRKYKDSDAWLWTEVAAVVTGLAFVIPTAIALWVDLKDRKTQRITQAWQLVTQVSPGNSGKGPALEYLNSQGIELVGIDLSTERNQGFIFLMGVNLPGANLYGTNLSGANLNFSNLSEATLQDTDLSGAVLMGVDLSGAGLNDANLSGAVLMGADLSGAELVEANLSGAELSRANLSGAVLFDANLSGAELDKADLSGADLGRADLSEAELAFADLSETDLSGSNLAGALNLSQKQLDTACGNKKTQLPEGFTVKPCLDE